MVHFLHTSGLGIVLLCLVLTWANVRGQHTAPIRLDDTTTALLKLRTLGYWLDEPPKLKSAATRQAIIAFQKVHKLKRHGKLTPAVITEILKAEVPIARDSIHQWHIEVDLNRQVLFIVDSFDRVERILSVSTGNGKEFMYPDKGTRVANTPRGTFKVYYKLKGVRESKLGILYDPLYIVGGVAIHGAPSVPAVPASHGCIRIPKFASAEMYHLVPLGTTVVVYGQNPKM